MYCTFWQFVEDHQSLQDRSACDLLSDNCEERNEGDLLELHSWDIRSQQEQYTLLCAAATRIVDNTFDGLLIWFATLCCIRLFHKLNQLLTHPTPMLFTVTPWDCVMEVMMYVRKLNLNKVGPLSWTKSPPDLRGLQASFRVFSSSFVYWVRSGVEFQESGHWHLHLQSQPQKGIIQGLSVSRSQWRFW